VPLTILLRDNLAQDREPAQAGSDTEWMASAGDLVTPPGPAIAAMHPIPRLCSMSIIKAVAYTVE